MRGALATELPDLICARIPEAQVDKRRPKVTGLEGCSSQGDEWEASSGEGSWWLSNPKIR